MTVTVDSKMLNVTASQLNHLQSAGNHFRNKIINGNMLVAQRGTSFTLNNGFTLDRWYVATDSTGGTYSTTQETFAAGSEIEGCFAYARFKRTAASSGGTYTAFTQSIEDVRTLNGKTVTLSFWARGPACTVNLEQRFGAGGSATVAKVTQFTFTTTWTKYTWTTPLNSVAGKTLGSTASKLQLIFYLPTNATFDFQITAVQLEEGSVATPFEVKPMSIETTMCQRYFVKLALGARAYATASGNLINNQIILPVKMYAMPTRTLITTGSRNLVSVVNTPNMIDSRCGRIEIVSSAAGDCYCLNEIYAFEAEI